MPAEATSAAETTGPHSCTSPREGPGDGPSSTAPHANARHGLTQPLPIPGPLRNAARPTQPLEPILFPKLRIRFADFPYLHCSTTRGCSPWRPAADIGTVRHENHTVSLGFSRADESAPDTAGSAVLYGNNDPISGQADSRVSVPYKEKRTLPGTSADVS